MTSRPDATTEPLPARRRTGQLLIGPLLNGPLLIGPLLIGSALIGSALAAVAVHLYGLYRVTGPPSPSWFPHSDKVEHAVGFGLPVFLILLALRRLRGCGPARQLLVIGAFAGHAVVSELIQRWFYTYRTGDPRDVLADWIGVGLGWVGYRLVAARSARSRR